MRRFFLVIAFLGASFAQTNLLQNPGFETWTGGNPDNWESTGALSASQENTIVHGGSYSVKLYFTSTTTQYLYQDIDINGCSPYTISVWVYDNDPAGRARLYVRWLDSNGNYISSVESDYTSDSDAWQQLTISANSPPNADSASVQIRLYDVSGSWSGSATIYADDVSFSLPATNQPPSICNIQRTPMNPKSTDQVTISAVVIDPEGDNLTSNYLAYSIDNGSTWITVNGVNTGGDNYTYQIPQQSDQTFVEYYIYAEDANGNSTKSSTDNYTVRDITPPIINEIMYNPDNSIANGGDYYFEYVEIFNPDTTGFDVSDWTIGDDASSFTIPNGTIIPPLGYLVVSNDTDSLKSQYGPSGLNFLRDGDDSLFGNFTFSLNNSEDVVILRDNNGSIIDSVHYKDSFPWPTDPDGNGPSLGLKNPDLDNESSSNWCSETGIDPVYGGTPGSENECENVVLNNSFESWTNGVPDYWNIENEASTQENTTDKHRGQRSVSLLVTTDEHGLYQNIEQVVGGNTYTLSAWVKAAGNVNSHPSVGIELEFYNGNWNYVSTDGPFYPSTSGGWRRIVHQGTIPGSATKMKIHIIGFSTTKGTAGSVDDISFISSGAEATGVSENSFPSRPENLRIAQRGNEIIFTIGNSGGNFTLEIFNVAGQKIFRSELSSKLTLRSRNFRKGVYFAIVKSENRILARARFVVIR